MENAEPPREHQQISWLVIGLMLLPVLYLGSVGPLRGFAARGIISDSAWQMLCASVYAPLCWLETETNFFDTLLGSAYIFYLDLFEP